MQDNTNPENVPFSSSPSVDARQWCTNMYTEPKKELSTIPFNSYFIDSGKFYIDSYLLKKINIPNQFLIVDKKTGNVLDDFKKHSLNIPYKKHKIYLALERKVLPHKTYEKVMFYFPAKINPEAYFYGITKEMVLEVLSHIQSLGYIDFYDIESLYESIELKDLDIKVDYKFNWTEKQNISKYNHCLSQRFNGQSSQFKSFNNKSNGLGIQTYERNSTTLKKPFMKFYSKSDEILKEENSNLFFSMSLEIQKQCKDYLIYRYEYTIKTMPFFNHFGISNKLKDILELSQSKLKEIGRHYLITNFLINIKAPKDMSKLTPVEKILTMMIYSLIQQGKKASEIELLWLQDVKGKTQRLRNKRLFERCYQFATVPNEETKELIETYNNNKRFDKIFGF